MSILVQKKRIKTDYDFRQVWRDPIDFLSFGFGSGLSPVAPGTCGTLAAIPLYLLIAHLGWWLYALLLVVLIVLGCWWAEHTERKLGVHDYSGIVIDEILGYLLTMWMLPVGWVWVLLGFVLFRVFDIFKPWPISWIQRHVDGGIGVVVDDLAAAVPAWIILQLIHKFCG